MHKIQKKKKIKTINLPSLADSSTTKCVMFAAIVVLCQVGRVSALII